MCPDFPSPPGGGATAAQVWAYGTKELTGDAANVIRDAILSDATKIAGANVDVAISAVKAKTDNLPVDPADQSLVIAATNALSTEIATRSPSGEYDVPMGNIDAAVSSRADAAEFTPARAAKIDKVQDFVEEAFGTLTATGAEDTIKEILTTINKLHCFIDLTAMQAGDTIIVRQYMTIKSAGSPVKYAEETISDVQALPMLYVVTKPARYGIKITLEQTVGAYRDFDWETFQEKAA